MTKPKFSYTRKFLSGEMQIGGWGFISGITGTLISLLILKGLTIYEYGVFQLMLSAYGFFSDIPSSAKGSAGADLMQFAGEGNDSFAKRLYLEMHGVQMLGSILLWALLFFGSSLFVPWYGEEFSSIGKVLSFLFLANGFMTFVTSIFGLKLNFGITAFRRTMQKIIQVLFLSLVFFADHTLTIKEVLWSMFVASVGATFIVLPSAIRVYKPWTKIQMHKKSLLLKNLKTSGKWAVASRVFSSATSRIQPWLIKLFVGTEAVAIFSVANTMASTLQDIIPTRTLGTLLNFGISNKSRSRDILHRGVKYHFILACLLALAGFVFVPIAVRLFLKEYIQSLQFFYILLFTIPLNSLASIPTWMLASLRRQKFLFFHRILKTVIRILLMFLLMPLFGLWGLALQKVLVSLILVIVTYFYISRSCHELNLRIRETMSFKKDDILFFKGIIIHLRIILVSKMSKFSALRFIKKF